MQNVYFVLLQPNMLVGGRRCAVEYFKAGRAVQKSDELSIVAKLLLNLSLYFYKFMFIVQHIEFYTSSCIIIFC